MKKFAKFLIIYFVISVIFIVLLFNGFEKNPFIYYIGGISLLFWYATFFVYLFQIAIIIIGLIFHFIKEKQTINNLLIPYGFIFTLKKYYKELK